MATTTVRGVGRARYERNKKHAQRTPLPPRDGEESTPAPAVKPRPAAKKASATTARAKARAIVKEEAERVVAEKRADEAEKPARMTKAQELATAAEEAGWDVERIVKGTRKTLIATRGEERLEANWENDRSCTPLGYHEINGHRAKFNHVTVAKKIVATEAGIAAANAQHAVARKSAPRKTITAANVAAGVPFDPATISDDDFIEAVRGRRITWSNSIANGEISESGLVPLAGKMTRVDADDLKRPETRQLTFCSADGGGYQTVRLGAITSVGAHIEDDGHTVALLRLKAAKEHGKKED